MVGHLASLLTDQGAGFGIVVLINGPGYPWSIARFAVDALAAVAAGEDKPPPRSAPQVEAENLAGAFVRGEGDGPDELWIERRGDPEEPVRVRLDAAPRLVKCDWADGWPSRFCRG